jgi:hypothetical protein
MKALNMPGFTADASIGNHRSYHSTANGSRGENRNIIPQLRIGGGGIGGGGLGFHWPSWCEIGCASAAALCIAATEGIGIAACLASELTCLAGCNSSSAGGGVFGGGIA